MAPQIDEPTYIYEQQSGTVVAGPSQSSNLSDHMKKDNSSAEREHSGEQVGQTVYVDHSNSEEAEALRYTNVHVRYADEAAYQISRYEYHQSQQHQQQQQQHVSAAHAAAAAAAAAQQQQQHEEIKNEIERNHHEQAVIHNYENSEGGHRSESQQQAAHSAESKSHYTNLEPPGPTQNYYIASEGYQPASGSFSYLSASANKDFAVYHPNSPNAVLYKGMRMRA